MKYAALIIIFLLTYSVSYAQEQENIIAALEQYAELMAEEGVEKQGGSLMLQLENLKKHPINLNRANADDLKELPELSDLQIESFLSYRRLFGDLLNIYELQAIPTWNINTIQKLLPFITVVRNTSLANSERWNNGSHAILIRSSRILEKSLGYTSQSDSSTRFMGTADRLMIRYSYNYRNLLQWGISGDKDAGERLFKGSQKAGFDFYSFHFFLSRLGIIKSLAIGDFTVNMGQGLIRWQGLTFSKSPEITSVKRQSPVLHPYTATGESNFHRGAGITLQKGTWECTLFFSYLKFSGNLVKDSVTDIGHITSIITSGYHRTPGEQEDKNNLQQITAVASFKFTEDRWHLAINAVQYKFSLPLKKEEHPYTLYAATGKSFENESIDYSYTYKNVHFFGELAVDKNYHTALVSGLLASMSPAADLSLVYRSISKSYQSFDANAFTENTDPVNEKGLYAGLCLRPSEHIQLNAYTDRYSFPWLKYRVDAPSSGSEYFIQLILNPNRQVELYGQFRSQFKQQNVSNGNATARALSNITKQNLRVHSSVTISRSVSFRSRAEITWYNKKQPDKEEGFLMFTDLLYKPVARDWSGNMRLAYFETNGYNSRLYTFENDVPYSFSIPATYDKGYRYYINMSSDVSRYFKYFLSKKTKAECSFRFSQSIYTNKDKIGSGLDEIKGNKKTELKFQIMIFK